MRKRIFLELLPAAGLVLTCGCIKTVEMRVLSSITLADIGKEIDTPAEDIVYYETSPSRGRFPAGISVARIIQKPQDRSDHDAGTLRLYPLESHEATYWAELFDGTPEIREMVMIHANSVRQQLVTKAELIKAAGVMKTKLLLIYGYDNVTSTMECTVSGVLYDVPSDDVVATITHTVTLAEARAQAEQLPPIKQPQKDADYDFYMDFLTFRGFEEKVRNCTWTLIDNDEDTSELQPNPYENPKPAYPRAWRRR